MIKTLHGTVHGRIIELEEELGVADGQKVEVQVSIIPPTKPAQLPISEGLAEIYAILAERYNSGHTDTTERHNEHQP